MIRDPVQTGNPVRNLFQKKDATFQILDIRRCATIDTGHQTIYHERVRSLKHPLIFHGMHGKGDVVLN